MPVDDAAIEAEIQAKGLTAPPVTSADIEAAISCEYFTTAGDAVGDRAPVHASLDRLTLCFLVLRNGFTVVGKSACASWQKFDAALGRKIARADAVNQIWPLAGYEFCSKLAEQRA